MRLNSILLHPPYVVLPWHSTSNQLQTLSRDTAGAHGGGGKNAPACAHACACRAHMYISDASCRAVPRYQRCARACLLAACPPCCSLSPRLNRHTSTKCEFVAPHCTAAHGAATQTGESSIPNCALLLSAATGSDSFGFRVPREEVLKLAGTDSPTAVDSN